MNELIQSTQFILFFISILVICAAIYGYFFQKKKYLLKQSLNKVFLLVTLPRSDSQSDRERDRGTGDDFKQKIARMEQCIAALHSTYKGSWMEKLYGEESISLEMAANFNDQEKGIQISFYVVCSKDISSLVERQITAYYPDAVVDQVPDYNIFAENSKVSTARFSMTKEAYYPIRAYDQFESDPMNGILNAISVLHFQEGVAIQVLLKPKDEKWSKSGRNKAHEMFQGKKEADGFLDQIGHVFKALFFGVKDDKNPLTGKSDSERLTPAQEELIKKMEEKSNKPIFDAVIRIVSSAPNQGQADSLLANVVAGFRQFTMYDLNGLESDTKQKANVVRDYMFRFFDTGKFNLVLSTAEIVTMFHFPNSMYNPSPMINWMKFKVAPAPAVLPKDGLLLGHNVYRGVKRDIRIAEKDRFRHLYIIGQTGMGKSVLQKALIKQDLANGYGVCVVDPHGDLVDECLEWVPKERAKDVILFDPNDTSRPVGLNLLEAKTPEEEDFIALDAMNMMIGLFGNEIFGPRIQDYFRNGCLTLMADKEDGGALTDIVRLFTDDAFQRYKVTKVVNPIVRSFWENQMAKTGEKEKQEMIPYFAAKFGAFITNTTMRNIVGQTKASFDFSEAMDTRKIIFAKLAKGLIGDINANLLGMIFVNKIQVAAMRRALQVSDDRVPFFLYVDEFQNFVTDAFESILSEARKYKLGLVIAHQYINQLVKDNNDKVKNAVFGNVGTMLNFKIGAQDAEYMAKEMAPSFTEQDLIALEGFKACLKLNVNNIISRPFSLDTVKDFDRGDKKLAETIIQISRLKYGRDVEFVNREILMRIGAV